MTSISLSSLSDSGVGSALSKKKIIGLLMRDEQANLRRHAEVLATCASRALHQHPIAFHRHVLKLAIEAFWNDHPLPSKPETAEK